MASRSWLAVEPQDPRFCLPEDLRRKDPFGARDIGWVEQMRPFVREFCPPGGRVLDPFAGLGSTLLATGLEGRIGLGFELNSDRVALTNARLSRFDGLNTVIRCGELPVPPPSEANSCDLALTSVPYFGANSTLAVSNQGTQLYASESYQAHLDHLGLLFHRLRRWLKPNAYCVVMAENLRIGDSVLPLAWDLAALLSDLYQRGDERVLLYPARSTEGARPMRADRSHEYALVFQNTRTASLHRSEAMPWLEPLWAQGLNFALHGSAAKRWCEPDSVELVADVDLLFDPGEHDLDTAATWLHAQGFALRSWGRQLAPPLDAARRFKGRYAIVAERIDRGGRRLRFDLGFELDGQDVKAALASAEWRAGLRIAAVK